MKNYISILYLLTLTWSCIFIRMDDSIDLGGNYRYIQDYPQSILYHKTSEYKGMGLNAISPIVKKYNYNDRYIIAFSQRMEDNKEEYWLIDKQEEFSEISPLDSTTFFQRLEQYKINLKLK